MNKLRQSVISMIVIGLSGCDLGDRFQSHSSNNSPDMVTSMNRDLDLSVGEQPGPDLAPSDGSVVQPPDLQGHVGPPVLNGQKEDLVLGEPDFVTKAQNSQTGTNGQWMANPVGVASDGTHLWVGDGGLIRLMQWNAAPTTNGQTMDVVIGPSTFTDFSIGPTQNYFAALTPIYVWVSGSTIFATDSGANRIMIWNAIPSTNGPPANLVLGQVDYVSNGAGKAATQLDSPQGLWSDGSHLIVADSNNSRVLIWNTMPTTKGQAADVVIGRAAFGIGNGDPIANPPTASTMNKPFDVFFDGASNQLFVADSGNNRIMVWNGIPTTNGAPASYVIGQSSVSGSAADAGGAISASGYDNPIAVLAAVGSLFVSDFNNHRVLVYTPVPTAAGRPADAVLGQNDFVTGTSAQSANDLQINGPRKMAVLGHKLFVADVAWARVLRWDLSL